jgi:hypothetical protein
MPKYYILYTKVGLSPYRQYSTVAMILEFDSCHLDFDDEMSNYKTDQPLVRYMINSWSFFRARVDQLHMSYNASYIFFSAVQTNKLLPPTMTSTQSCSTKSPFTTVIRSLLNFLLTATI